MPSSASSRQSSQETHPESGPSAPSSNPKVHFACSAPGCRKRLYSPPAPPPEGSVLHRLRCRMNSVLTRRRVRKEQIAVLSGSGQRVPVDTSGLPRPIPPPYDYTLLELEEAQADEGVFRRDI